MGLLLSALGAVTVFVFFLYGYDKWCACRSRRRIREHTLLFWAFWGALGAALGMLYFRHKTKKKNFVLLIPSFLLIDTIGVLGWLFWI